MPLNLTSKKRPRPEALDELTSLFLGKRREIEASNPSGGYASFKLWRNGREQTLPEAVEAVVAAHGRLLLRKKQQVEPVTAQAAPRGAR